MHSSDVVEFVRGLYKTDDFIPLHAPTFSGNERRYVVETIDSTFVSSVGVFVDRFEHEIELFTGAARAVATVNGTAALHAALYVANVTHNDFVITQPLTFVATCNAIYQSGAQPIFCDVSLNSLSLCPSALEQYLADNAEVDGGQCLHKESGKVIRAVVVMHTFGHPAEMDEIADVCCRWRLCLIEDAAESLGSYYKGVHTGTMGDYGALSFNGNKIITTGGGGMLLCKSADAGRRVKHVTTTSKVPHQWEFYHDEPGFNYRLPNINAALGCAQMEVLPEFLQRKRALANAYEEFFRNSQYRFFVEPEYAQSNYWLNALICSDKESRDLLLEYTNQKGVMTRPVWKLMHRLPMFSHLPRGDLSNSEMLEGLLINLPSTPIFLNS